MVLCGGYLLRIILLYCIRSVPIILCTRTLHDDIGSSAPGTLACDRSVGAVRNNYTRYEKGKKINKEKNKKLADKKK